MGSEKTKVLVVEDSLVFRSLLVKYINADPDLEVVAVANDPFEARDAIVKFQPDVMTLDIELPKMTGIEFLRKLMPQFPVRTIVISSLSDRVFEALRVGAVDFVAKPVVTERAALDEFVRNELPEKIKAAANARLRASYGKIPERMSTKKVQDVAEIQPNGAGGLRKTLGDIGDIIVAIGASTGGTEATSAILERLGGDIPPVVVTQHMPEGFTKMYADRLNNQAGMGVKVKEAEQGELLERGCVYIAPGGDRHMEIVRRSDQYYIKLTESDKVNGHRPSVEVLFNSVAKAAGKRAVGIILTGMGGDGAKGLLNMRNAGAITIGQDESTCVVYGMPKVAYDIGAVEYQEKLLDIPQKTYFCVESIIKRDNL